MVLSGAMATGMSLAIRALAGDIPSTVITFVRCLLGMLIVAPLALQPERWRTQHLGMQVLRGLAAAVAINCGYYALTVLPLTAATVLFFSAPLYVTALAPWLLQEPVGWRRWGATITGFVGVVIVLRPAPSAFDPNALVALVAGLFFALVLIIGRRMAANDRPSTVMLYTSTVTTMATLPPALAQWRLPDNAETWLLLAVAAGFGTARTYADIRAYAEGDTSFVSVFQYLRLLMIAVGAYFLFSETPDAGTLTGGAVIIAATLYISQREARLGRGSGGRVGG